MLNSILSLTPLTLVEVATKRLLREAASWSRMNSAPLEQPYWFYQGMHKDGKLIVASPGGSTELIDALDVMNIIPMEPIRTRAMSPRHYIEWDGMNRRGIRIPPDALYSPCSVLGAIKVRYGRFDYFVAFDDPSLNTSSTWQAPIPDEERARLLSLTRRTRMPVRSSSSAGWSSDSEVQKIERTAQRECRGFFSQALVES